MLRAVYVFILDRRGKVVLQPIDQSPVDFGSRVELFRQAFNHERDVTSLIHHLYGLSIQEKDFAGQPLLQWFTAQQIEEEKITSEVMSTLELVGDSG